MAFQLWLAECLEAAGLKVVQEPSWRTRSADEDDDASTYGPQGCIIHETRGSATSTEAGEISVLVNGRTGLSGPIAQLFLSRAGVWHVVAAGLCHHVKTGWGGPFEGFGNTRLLGIEAQHAESESWAAKPAQYDAYVRGVAAVCKHAGWPPPVGHKEHQPGDKPDPEFDMTKFRADVRAAMDGDDMSMLVRLKGDTAVWIADGIIRRRIDGEAEWVAVRTAVTTGQLPMAKGVTIADVASLAPYGVDVASLGAKVELSDAQLDALADKLAARLGKPATPAEIAVAVVDEDHRRSES